MSCDSDMDPRERACIRDNQEMSEVPRRGYSDAAKAGLNVDSPQPNILRHDPDYLRDATKNNDLPKRPCSLYFHLSVPNFDVPSLLQDVKRCGIVMSAVRCAQKVSKDAFIITFKTPEDREMFSKKSELISRQPEAVISVTILDAPCELPDDAIKHRLSAYGRVQKIFRRTYTGYHVETGVRTVKMIVDRSLPSFLRFGRRLVRVHHEGQVPTCRKCNYPGHVAKDCKEKVCFNCEEHGHEAPDCVHALLCSICKSSGHWAHNCKYSWIRHRDAPVDERPGTSLASEMQVSQPLPAASDVSEFSSPQLLFGSSSSSSSGSSSSSPATQSSPDRMDDDVINDGDDHDGNDGNDDKDDGDDNDGDDDNNDDDGDDDDGNYDDMDVNKTDDSCIPGDSPTVSEQQMIRAVARVTQENSDSLEMSEESNTNKRRASSLKRKSRSSKKKR